MASSELLITCEHARNAVPARFDALLPRRGRARLLASHRGYDPGALDVARLLAKKSKAPLVSGHWTRLLVDLNRSPTHPRVVPKSARAHPILRVALLEEHARHTRHVQRIVEQARGQVVHVAVHSFVPVLEGRARGFDIGLLYDPARPGERQLAARLRGALLDEGFSVRRNAPYRGVSDGLPTALRRKHTSKQYLGFELELNQAWLLDRRLRERRRPLVDALLRVLQARS